MHTFPLSLLFAVSDFTSVSDVLVTFAPGESQKTVTVVTTVDSVVEGIELFSAIITSTSVSVTITDETASITILETGNGEHGNKYYTKISGLSSVQAKLKSVCTCTYMYTDKYINMVQYVALYRPWFELKRLTMCLFPEVYMYM